MKAQQVKNAVIVPVGSKGGFYPKRLPKGGAPDAIRAEAVGAYKTFLYGLLDLTDNIDADGKVVHPPRRASSTTATIPTWSSPPTRAPPPSPTSPTASPSPTASGSATPSPPAARPATTTRPWASPPAAPGRRSSATSASSARTSRPSRSPCVGVGDMSGDVFGNGMLLSKQTRLVAAFDHRHVFLDPDPDPASQLGRAQAPVRPAALVLGRLRRQADLAGRRGLPAHPEVGPAQRRGEGAARPARSTR